MCGAHATVRGLLGELVARSANGRDIIVDMEAGLEHLSRGTGKHVSRFLAVVEPYYRSMETARRIAELAAELGIADVQAVANKVRDADDRKAIAEFCAAHRLPIVAEVPYDATLVAAERSGVPPIDADPTSAAVAAVGALARTLLSRAPA
jgi:CO dehydrogenase maturation factor